MKKVVLIIIDGLLIVVMLYCYFFFKTPKIYNISIDNTLTSENKIKILAFIRKPSKTKVLCSINNKDWIEETNNTCEFAVDNGKYVLSIKDNKRVYKKSINVQVNKVTDIIVDTSTIYLPVNGSKNIEASLNYIGKINSTLQYKIENEQIAKYESGLLTGLSKGKTKLIISADGKIKEIDVIITDLIQKMEINNNKALLQCNEFNEEDQTLLDTIMDTRIKEAGGISRGSVIAVARFISMEFVRRIPYFPENGRLPRVDGEGRYYHKGFYLTESNFSKLSTTSYGPTPWGCKMYSSYARKQMQNGLDCSGYISWVLLNAGFDTGDIGAGVLGGADLTDYGQRIKLNNDALDKIKVGDLLNSNLGGGHIALIVGFDGENYYVTEELWDTRNYGALVQTYTKNELIRNFLYVVLMDEYYKKDGNYRECKKLCVKLPIYGNTDIRD